MVASTPKITMNKTTSETAQRIVLQRVIEHPLKFLEILNSNGSITRRFLVNVEEHTAVELLVSFDARIPNIAS